MGRPRLPVRLAPVAVALAAAMLAVPPAPARAATGPCAERVHEGRAYTVCEVAAGADLRIFQQAPDGAPYGSFERVEAALAAEGARLGFAMNAGMYHDDRSPVGLMIEAGDQRAPLVTADGPGNFGLLPNGVFCVGEGFRVIESRAFAADPPACRYASQSGPMLLIDGALHPRFLPGSPSRYVRNGVGVSADGQRAWFVISQERVNFAEFARVFRDALGARDALYFDGNVSRLYAPGIGRDDIGFRMGPIVGLVVPAG
jgi:uncharacterized protein YigE (DUF2233 family)